MAQYSSPDDAVAYLQRTFPRLGGKRSRLPLPNRRLGVTILECDGLGHESTAPTHPDVYCVFRVNGEHKTSTTRKECADSVYWGEEFVVDVDETAAHRFTIELRKVREQTKRSPLKTIRTVLRKTLFVASPKKYDILGDISVPLVGIPRDGLDIWQGLRDGTGDPSDIRIKFRLCFLAQLPVVFTSRTPTKDHYGLTYAFLTRTLRESSEKAFQSKRWEDCLPRPAMTLLHQNAVQRGLTSIETLSCYVKVIASVRSVGLGRINCAVVHDLLEGLRQELNDNPVFRTSMKHVLEQTYHQTCEILEKYHPDFDQRDDFEALDLQAALWCRGFLVVFREPREDAPAEGTRVVLF